ALDRGAAEPGEEQSLCPLAGHRRFHGDGHHALAAHLHRRSRARRLRPAKGPLMTGEPPLLTVEDLSVSFRSEGREVRAVKHISFEVKRGETLALVGESGSGKSTAAMSVLQLLPYPTAFHPGGSVRFDGQELLGAGEAAMQRLRGGRIALIPQEP